MPGWSNHTRQRGGTQLLRLRMPAYHSAFTPAPGCPEVCGCPLLPLRAPTRGPTPALPLQDPPQDDIVEEALTLFRANILFRNFEPRGGADRILLYLQLIILQALKRCSGRPRADAARELHTLASGPHVVPGDAGWPLGSLLPAPKTAVEADAVRAYFRQLRETLVPRLLARLYSPDAAPSEMPNKHWMQFSKRKFMGREFADR